jgi:predicted DNA-binding mobile mystery protein A
MTTAQFARRLGVKQPRVIRLEQAEVEGALTLDSLDRAARALGCRLVYVLVPEQPLSETMRARAAALAETRLVSIEHTMRLEDQAVKDNARRAEAREQIIAELLRKPARLWDDP